MSAKKRHRWGGQKGEQATCLDCATPWPVARFHREGCGEVYKAPEKPAYRPEQAHCHGAPERWRHCFTNAHGAVPVDVPVERLLGLHAAVATGERGRLHFPRVLRWTEDPYAPEPELVAQFRARPAVRVLPRVTGSG